MSIFHSGMNFWQRKALSAKLHKKSHPSVLARSEPSTSKIQPVKDSALSVAVFENHQKPPGRKKCPPRPAKITWPDADTLAKLLWEMPTSKIAQNLGVSDKAVEKHCKKLELKKPPRGYWAKRAAGQQPPYCS